MKTLLLVITFALSTVSVSKADALGDLIQLLGGLQTADTPITNTPITNQKKDTPITNRKKDTPITNQPKHVVHHPIVIAR